MKLLDHVLPISIANGIAVICAAALVAGTSSAAHAAGVVGTGTAASCTDEALNTALAGGGMVRFNCDGLATIDINTGTGGKMIAADTTVDGEGLVTISGGDSVAVFSVNSGVTFTVRNLTIANGNGPFGGGISNDGGTVGITNGTFTDNHASFGGGIYSVSGELTVTNSTFKNNSADIGMGALAGGGIYNNEGVVTVTNSTFTGNRAGGLIGRGDGAGIYNDGALDVANSTFTDNSAHAGDDGPGVAGIFSFGGPVTVTNSTFTGNVGIAITASAVMLRNTIIVGDLNSCSGGITDGGHNLDDGTSCGFAAENSSLSSTDPHLDPVGLQDNGGPTQTVALCTAAGVPAGCTAPSPAIGAGDPSVCAAAPLNGLDQRGFMRPGTGHTTCSMGAYEADAVPPEEVCIGDCNGNGVVAINELIVGVNIIFGALRVNTCPAFADSQQMVDVAQLVKGVKNVLIGCGLS